MRILKDLDKKEEKKKKANYLKAPESNNVGRSWMGVYPQDQNLH